MQSALYADVLFLVNFSMDYVTLYLTKKLTCAPQMKFRAVLSAAIGGLYGTLSVIFSIDGIVGAIAAVAVSALLVVIAFGRSGAAETLRRAAVFWGSAALLGGLMTAICSAAGSAESAVATDNTAVLLIGSAFCTAITKLILKSGKAVSVRVRVALGDDICEFEALCDSGNLLREPLSSRPVIIADRSRLRGLVPTLCTDTAEYAIPQELASRIRMIPVDGVNGHGLLYGFSPDSVTIINGRKEKPCDAVIAVSPHGSFGGFYANAPASIV